MGARGGSIRKLRADTRGMSLVEVLIATGLVCVWMLMMAGFFRHTSDAAQYGQATAARDQLVTSIRKAAGMSTALRESANVSAAAGQPALMACLSLNNANDCQMLSNPQAFTLVPGPGGLPPIAGLYDMKGQPCGPPASVTCPFQVVVLGFKPQCQAMPNSYVPAGLCDVAETIEIQFQVKVADDPANPGTPLKLGQNQAGAGIIAPVNASVVHIVKDVSWQDPSQFSCVSFDPGGSFNQWQGPPGGPVNITTDFSAFCTGATPRFSGFSPSNSSYPGSACQCSWRWQPASQNPQPTNPACTPGGGEPGTDGWVPGDVSSSANCGGTNPAVNCTCNCPTLAPTWDPNGCVGSGNKQLRKVMIGGQVQCCP